jgi:hypothetical protein
MKNILYVGNMSIKHTYVLVDAEVNLKGWMEIRFICKFWPISLLLDPDPHSQNRSRFRSGSGRAKLMRTRIRNTENTWKYEKNLHEKIYLWLFQLPRSWPKSTMSRCRVTRATRLAWRAWTTSCWSCGATTPLSSLHSPLISASSMQAWRSNR